MSEAGVRAAYRVSLDTPAEGAHVASKRESVERERSDAAHDADVVIIGSGFGGSVMALRLVEKGYRVRLFEKGSELKAKDFPTSNWNLKRWLWMPWLGFRGLFQMTFFRHLTVLSGVGVGGGSLVYAATHPEPNDTFYGAESWSHLADWKAELRPHYDEVKRMLGVSPPNFLTPADRVLRKLAREDGRPEAFQRANVAVYFGAPGETVDDPYLGGEGPSRTGCIRCGGCMLGCKDNAKNTLDKNYLYLARKRGLELTADAEVTFVRPLEVGGYEIEVKRGRHPLWRRREKVTAREVVFAGGVLGTLDLLLKLKSHSGGLPRLSDRLGAGVRTNSESLIAVVSNRRDADLSEGVTIGSTLQTDDHSHLQIGRYRKGSGFYRLMLAPHVGGGPWYVRLFMLFWVVLSAPLRWLRAVFVPDLTRYGLILLYMRSLDGTLRVVRSRLGLKTRRGTGPAPVAAMPEATALAHRVSEELDGMPFSFAQETLFDIPSTAHVLGGCCMGDSAADGVIDKDHRLFGYDGLYVVDGSAISANLGVNPSLTIAALAERAAARFPQHRRALEDEVDHEPRAQSEDERVARSIA